MNTSEIQERINPLTAAMSAKGLIDPNVVVYIRANETVSVSAHHKKTADRFNYDRSYWRTEAPASDYTDQLLELEGWIATLPSIEARRLSDFTEKLAEVIEMGREAGIDVTYVNPLVDAMKRLSENAITFQRAA